MNKSKQLVSSVVCALALAPRARAACLQPDTVTTSQTEISAILNDNQVIARVRAQPNSVPITGIVKDPEDGGYWVQMAGCGFKVTPVYTGKNLSACQQLTGVKVDDGLLCQ